MTRLIAIALLVVVFVSACESSTKWGPCIAIDRSEARPDREYAISIQNVVLAVVFVETVWVPLVVLLSETYCPIGPKGGGK